MQMKAYFTLFSVIMTASILMLSAGCLPLERDILTVDGEGNTSINKDALESTINQDTADILNESEKKGILYIRQEEKLARDVYSMMYTIWGIKNFNNIGASEQTHMDAMKSLVDRYGLEDPAKGRANGEFEDKKLQQLYDKLVAQGSKSDTNALKVGAAIEEIDIIDIENYIGQTDKEDIITVYKNLLIGSRNHLRSFISVMEKRRVTYEPQYLSDTQFNEIISAPLER